MVSTALHRISNVFSSADKKHNYHKRMDRVHGTYSSVAGEMGRRREELQYRTTITT